MASFAEDLFQSGFIIELQQFEFVLLNRYMFCEVHSSVMYAQCRPTGRRSTCSFAASSQTNTRGGLKEPGKLEMEFEFHWLHESLILLG
ncbi:hypothetical protein V6N13_023704 [Hibiscus sabdariffa]